MTKLNPINEIFDTQGAIEYLKSHGYTRISKPTIYRYKNIGRLLPASRLRVYFKRELDAFRNKQPYDRDANADYEAAIMSNLIESDDAAEYLGITYHYMKHLMADNKIQYIKLTNKAFFLQEWLDDYKQTNRRD